MRDLALAAGGGMFFWARLTGAGGKTNDAGEFAKKAIEQGVAWED